MKGKYVVATAVTCAIILVGCPWCPDCDEECPDERSVIPAIVDQPEPVSTKPEDIHQAATGPSDDQGDQMDKLHKGNPYWRTWTVFDADAELVHLKIGHAFRLQVVGGQVWLVPLTNLRNHWNLAESEASISLEKVFFDGETQTGESRLCGQASFEHEHGDAAEDTHPVEHGIKITYVSDDKLKIRFFTLDDPRSPEYRTLEQLCLSTKAHGGIAHIEN